MIILQLTKEQAEAARALGCRFVAATEAQIRQFSMQRRIFTIEGQPFLAARKDGFYETAGTLQALIAGAMSEQDAEPTPAPEPTPPQLVAREQVDEEEPLPDEPEDPVEAIPPPVARGPMTRATAAPHRSPQGPVMAATITIVKGYARRGTLDTAMLTTLVASVHQTLRRLA